MRVDAAPTANSEFERWNTWVDEGMKNSIQETGGCSGARDSSATGLFLFSPSFLLVIQKSRDRQIRSATRAVSRARAFLRVFSCTPLSYLSLSETSTTYKARADARATARRM